jgi:predicted negative regulator of RcsB-dependent stress response
VADKDDKKKKLDAPASKATPTFDPKPVNVGGESLVDRIYPHRKKIGMFILLGFAVWAVIAVVIHFRDSGHEKTTGKLAAVLDVASGKVVDPATPVDPNNPLKEKFPTFKTDAERANQVLDALAKQGTDVAGSAFKGSLLIKAGKLDEAITEYKRGQNAKGLDGVLAREGLGLAEEMKAEAEKDAATRQKGLEAALATFSTMQPDDKGPRYAYALYHQGRVQALLGKTADAKATLEKAKAAGKDSTELEPLVDARLASLGT